ncbi:Prolyl 3-hydroxylase OGFOD1 [Nosema granulosis]|uniref:Prolyl 3-hydroxylase OGFOD1 n=1 Tax=Nosema granulosis TaxID=83296 RepID=A0A9P6GYC4_9MICR|nr:Prolyl 3-hydroxylase OGFOD1 [Nosema granulosis]
MKEYLQPFKHFVIDDFLDVKDFKRVRDLHGEEEFFLKYTDLFKFLQTEEIAQKSNVKFFVENLERVFKDITDTTDCFYTIFGSYYREGDYLLAHDDKVEDRRYAFTYYLEDFPSGELVLYNGNCTEVVKRVEVKKNRLVIFEVSSISWHEVAYCKSNGRRAITGWINHKSINHKSINNNSINNNSIMYKDSYLPTDDSSKLPGNLDYVDFELDFDGSPVIQFPEIEYDFEHTEKQETGPFYMRRVKELKLTNYIALNINKYELIYIKAYEISDLDYILLNDYTNNLQGNIIDIFTLEADKNSEECIKFLNKDGKLQFTLTMLPKVLYAVKREDRKYFIENGVTKNFKLVHMIYRESN